jgi:hypothetical protein
MLRIPTVVFLVLSFIVPVAVASADNSAIVGVWKGKMDSLPMLTLTVEEENGKLIGAVLFYLIRRDPSGPPTASPGIPEPLMDPSFDGKTLTFKVSHRHAHPGTEHDPPVTFQFELESSGKLIGVNHEGPPVELVRDMPF